MRVKQRNMFESLRLLTSILVPDQESTDEAHDEICEICFLDSPANSPKLMGLSECAITALDGAEGERLVRASTMVGGQQLRT